jgi:two-component system sensor histidine kinase ChvG
LGRGPLIIDPADRPGYIAEPAQEAPADAPRPQPAHRAVRTAARKRRKRFSALTQRILAINVLALAFLLGGLLYLDTYREGLVEARLQSLRIQGELIAGALGESAFRGDPENRYLDPDTAGQLIRRLSETTGVRARLFDTDGHLVADSRLLLGAGRRVVLRVLPSDDAGSAFMALFEGLYDWVTSWLPVGPEFPPYLERADQRAEDYSEATGALLGKPGWGRRDAGGDGQVLTVAVPIQAFKRVHGALLLSTYDQDIEESVRTARLAIVQVFALALGVTVLLSIFLASTIARPIRRLADAADHVRRAVGGRAEIPDFTSRRDEIGELSAALRDMTEAMYARLDAIDSFAADVSHEIKNPLSSLRSAIETLARIEDPAQRKRLLDVIESDIVRLDRLISDISESSRIDAELSRAEMHPVDLRRLLTTLAEVYGTGEHGVSVVLDMDSHADMTIDGIEDRLGRVFRNLIDNAVTFSTRNGRIGLTAWRDEDEIEIRVEDEGPGLPEDKIESIFNRFYSDRPDGETFGGHSGLGLSICKQIIDAHGGTITADNRRDPMGNVVGARFIVRLPAA